MEVRFALRSLDLWPPSFEHQHWVPRWTYTCTQRNRAARTANDGGKLMSDLVFIAFPSEQKAEEVRQKILTMQKEYLIELGDAVVAVKDSDGRIKLNQMINTTAVGAVSGTFWGTLIGLIFLMPLAGAALGAASGSLGGYLTDVGIDDKWMRAT